MSIALHDSAAALAWLHTLGAQRLVSDSRAVQPGDVFVAWPGHARDGRSFVGAALAAGALGCLVEAEGSAAFGFDGEARVALLPGLKAATGPIAAAFHGHPSEKLRVVAITGTNGKTSTAWWMAQALGALGQRCAVAGTLGIGVPPALTYTGLTTPDPITLQQSLARLLADGVRALAIEASSIGIVEHRLAGTRVDTALYTNFTRDHLDFHQTMEDYWQAKRALFDLPGLRAAGINVDDPRGAALARELLASGLDLWTLGSAASGASARARLAVHDLRYDGADGGLSFTVVEGADSAPVRTPLIGDYNAANLLGVLAGLRAGGVALQDAAQALSGLTAVPGRMQRVGSGLGAPQVVVDYAHTPDALEKALDALRRLAAQRGGRLWCVFGCGGDRDATKRPLMGAAAAERADCVVVTSDNPRSESPEAIVEAVAAGARPLVGDSPRAKGLTLIVDRREAIAHALRSAQAEDVVLIAGKGHEDYQEVAGVRLPFSDMEEAEAALALRNRP